MDVLSIVFIYLGLGVILFALCKAILNAYTAKGDFDQILQRLRDELEFPLQEYAVFTDGHPYTWTEAVYDEIVQDVQKKIPRQWYMYRIPPYPKMACWYQVDNRTKNIYMVPWVSEFDGSHLMHYQEWLESEPGVAKNVAKHREGHTSQ